MATQTGVVKLRGSIDDITFRRTKSGYKAGIKSSLTKERYMTDPKFIRARENGQEFGRACTSGKVFRLAFKNVIGKGHGKVATRMQKLMMQCLKGDPTSARGERKVSLGDLSILDGFEFNESGVLHVVFKGNYVAAINRTTGAVTVTIDPFTPNADVVFPAGATHLKLVSVASEIDFDGQTDITDSAASTYITIDNNSTTSSTLTTNVTPATTKPIFLALGIHFFQEVNGQQYAMNTGTTDAIAIIKVDV